MSINLPQSLMENPQVIGLIDDLGLFPSIFLTEFELKCEGWFNSIHSKSWELENSSYWNTLELWRSGKLSHVVF